MCACWRLLVLWQSSTSSSQAPSSVPEVNWRQNELKSSKWVLQLSFPLKIIHQTGALTPHPAFFNVSSLQHLSQASPLQRMLCRPGLTGVRFRHSFQEPDGWIALVTMRCRDQALVGRLSEQADQWRQHGGYQPFCASALIFEMFLLVRQACARIILWHDVECLDPATRKYKQCPLFANA